MSVDTLSLARQLRAVDLDERQAEAIATATGQSGDGAQSAADLLRLEAKLDRLAERLEGVLRLEIANLRAEIKTEANGFRSELKAEMHATVEAVTARLESARASLLTWIVSVLVAGFGVVVAIMRR